MFFNISKIKEDKLFQKSYNKKFKSYDVEINFIQNEDNFIYTQHSPLAGIVHLPDVGSYWSFKITCYMLEEDLNNSAYHFKPDRIKLFMERYKIYDEEIDKKLSLVKK